MGFSIYDQTSCVLGEGPLWHPERGELFWFDIVGKTLYRREDGVSGGGLQQWKFPEHVSAAGWIDRDTLLVASQSALLRFDINTGDSQFVHSLEADNPITRSNDGRADPWGGFWIGTVGMKLEPDAGAIYRYYRGELRQLYRPISVSNAICFSPDRHYAYYCDTPRQVVWKQNLEQTDGWPVGEPEKYLDFTGTDIYPDGAVCDSQGYFWNAQWGSARLARYSPEGHLDSQIKLPTDHITCPAFGGDDLCNLYATSATQGLNDSRITDQPMAGKTFIAREKVAGQREHRVIWSVGNFIWLSRWPSGL